MSAPFPLGSESEGTRSLASTTLALRRQAEVLESVLASMGDGVIVVDGKGRMVLANPEAARLLHAEVTDTPVSEWPRQYGLYRPDRVTAYPAEELPVARAIRGKPADRVEILVRHEGVPEGAWISMTARPLQTRRGRLRGAVAVFRDVTDRKQAEAEHAELLAREQAARIEAERTISLERSVEHRLKLLVEASGLLFHSLKPADVLPSVLELARQMVAADAYAIWRTDGASGPWRIVCSSGLSEGFREVPFESHEPAPSFDAPLVIENVLQDAMLEPRRSLHEGEGVRSMLAAPLRLHGVNSGSITFYWRQPRHFEDLEVRTASALANLASAAIVSAELYAEQHRLRVAAEASERRTAFLAQATVIIGSSLDYETTLAQVARLAVPRVADWCSVEMVEPDGSLRQLAVAHADAAKVQWAQDLRRRYPPNPDAPRGIYSVLRSGRSQLVAEVTGEMLAEGARDPEHLEILRQAGIASYMCVPMIARAKVLGAISFVSTESSRRYGPEDLEIAEHLGRRAALAVDNARLFEAAKQERAAAEASLEASWRSETRFRRLAESGVVGIIRAEGARIVEANAVFLDLVGYTKEELDRGGLEWRQLTPPESLEADARATKLLTEQGACAPFERAFLRKDGSRVPALVGSVLLDAPPRFSWISVVVDLTDRKRLEQRLLEAQKLESVGLLAGGVAHDFNNILTGILGNASLALEDLPPDSGVRPTLEAVVRASERAADLTRQLLAYSGKGRFIIQPLDLSELVRDLKPLVGMSVPKKIEVRFDLRSNLPLVEGDPTQLQQLILNLVLNGAEAVGGRAGWVRVATGVEHVGPDYERGHLIPDELRPGEYVVLEVQDDGCGMDEETLARIFDPFFTTKFTGRGLGLAAALGIVRGHGGDIHVRSAPGEGSTFRILLPATETVRAGLAGVQEPKPDLRGIGTILVVDDEDVVIETAKSSLERYGYRVLVARNGTEGVAVFREHAGEIKLVLLDMMMPVMSGEEAFDEIRAVRPEARVLVSSGYSETEAMARFRRPAVSGFIQKPYSAAQLAERIKAALAVGSRGEHHLNN